MTGPGGVLARAGNKRILIGSHDTGGTLGDKGKAPSGGKDDDWAWLFI